MNEQQIKALRQQIGDYQDKLVSIQNRIYLAKEELAEDQKRAWELEHAIKALLEGMPDEKI